MDEKPLLRAMIRWNCVLRAIAAAFKALYGADVPHSLSSKVTNAVTDRLLNGRFIH